ncbi:sigma-70 family RNA polymerase sigma factor [Vibrio salinus]|uniref:sigma-70 family RNA polymerase sigma factor n=1 Tax=Vibrio salinus TaxID=2899784 RepID=UPI001E59B642|nr:sigma-70 family RNA polymerase sigma factor [Vibrio salinus]MCE0492926.1 RNA polymerase sigma factor [Vibrio salinus]
MRKQPFSSVVPCLSETWQNATSDLYRWLVKQSGDNELAADLLQETFIRALTQKDGFCAIKNQRAWLYRVAGNLLTDEQRKQSRFRFNDNHALHQIHHKKDEHRPVDDLAQCLPKALTKLSPEDKDILESCDLKGMKQQDYATSHGLSPSAVKSRIQRARKKLKHILKCQCQIRFDESQQICCFSPQKTHPLPGKAKPSR